MLGRTLDEREEQTIRDSGSRLATPPEVDVILVGLGMMSEALAEELAEDFDGQAIEVPVQRLLQWWRDRP